MQTRSRRFTLLELLVVVGILATVAGAMLVSFSGVEEQAQGDLTRRELAEVKQAVLRFRADTGFLPKQGPFDLTTRGGAVPAPPQGTGWFDSPANLGQLFENPLPSTHPLFSWDPDRRRGWRGPYLNRGIGGQVVVGDGLALDAQSGGLDQGNLLPPLPARPDAFVKNARSTGIGAVFVWADLNNEPVTRQGRPYLLFGLDDPNRARVVGLGPDGRFALLSASDQLTAPGSDDVGVYLLR